MEMSQLLNLTHSGHDLQSASMPHSDSVDPISEKVKQYFHLTFLVIICGLISLMGIVTNIANIIVFVKQGFKDRINISLFSLAVADLGCVLTMLWTSISGSPLVAIHALPFYGYDVSYATGAWPHKCFNRVTSCITTFITLERCLCVIIPLKVKNTFTPLTTKVINVSIFVSMMTLFSPFYFVNNLVWIYHVKLNKSLVTLVQTQDRVLVESSTFPIHSVVVPVVSLVFVVVCTIVLAVTLNRKTKWRMKSQVNSKLQTETSSRKEQKVVKMVVFISTIFIGCYFPEMVIFAVMVVNTEFSFTGLYGNLFVVVCTASIVLQTLNSSVNMFVYLKMSSRFKATFIELFDVCTTSNVIKTEGD